MVFEFRILGLFLLFFLVSSYIFTYDKKNQHGIFSFVLFGSYVLEFLYLVSYIAYKNDFYQRIFMKFYYICLGLVIVFISCYFLMEILKEKYLSQGSKLEEKSNLLKKGLLFGSCIVTLLVLFFSSEEVIWRCLLIIFAGFSFSLFGVLLNQKKWIKEKTYKILFGFIVLEWIFIFFQIIFSRLEIMESGMILLTTYLYLFLENILVKEVNRLRLENEYAKKNLLDKESFLKKLSHELRIPLHTIDGFSQLMEDADDIKVLKEDAKDIRTASLELIGLVDSMIDLSILESGELKIINENYAIYDVLEDLIEMIPSRLKSKEIKFKSSIEKGMPEVLLGDADRLKQVILNIISNSIKYTEKGSISLDVSSVKSSSLCRLIIKISDTGKGMSQEEINHLFDKENNEKGIGLKIAHYLLELMNGKLDIESTVDEYTIVTISLDQEIVSLKNTFSKKEKNMKIVSFKGKRVLIVDDNKLNLKVAEKLLLPYELEIVSVSSGNECLELLDKDNNFDLILMDDLMPNMTGTETLDVLRKIERVSGFYIPVVVLTANAVNGMKEKYLEVGFDDYLAKPIERIALDEVLKKYLKK